MKKIIFASALSVFLLSCEKKTEESTELQSTVDSVTVPESSEPLQPSTIQNCYLGVTGKDSVFVSVEDNLGTIIGKMRYKNFEKDSSHGEISGTQNGDTLKLNYVFEAEGMTSEREIYFVKKDGKLIEGIGEQKTEGNIATYSAPGKIKYEGHELSQVDCTKFETQFKF